jgi:sulfoxide reductase heme-binding subunit YedZ
MFDEDVLLESARFIGISGLFLLTLSGIGGALMASRTVQQINIKWLRGKTFKYHRMISLIGAGLLLLHPVPMLWAPNLTGGLNFYHVFIPFAAPKQGITIGIGVITFYVLLIVVFTSIFIKYLRRSLWRALHFGTYLIIFLGLLHGLLISGEFNEAEVFDFDEPEKVILMIILVIALALPVWRLFLAKKYLPNYEQKND